jgi:3-hydroxybutyrate dehydrogenase
LSKADGYLQPFSNFWNAPGKPPSKDKPSESRYSLLDINLTHPIRVTQMAISHFLAQKKPGVIPHISSVAGQVPFFPTPVYVATKHAINGFVRSLHRLENPPPESKLPKIRVNACAPARILTPLWTEHPDKMKFVPKNPGWVMPDDVAKVMLDLVEKEEYVGGSIIEIGETARRVELFNDPGPSAGGNAVPPDPAFEADMWASLERQFKGE